ncbi:MAG: hypothetical protein OEY18_07445 [Candidatus Aminicenantes bacterium]|nr:hypothetical protein [Candidatus Aminicenantes bacterium]MDH5384524.1 hypothetical protein [Candidatus Aminicenantes bacterium]MDH5744108.1 hypothetical protein [Candidatus Aminicenantes bacterium]
MSLFALILVDCSPSYDVVISDGTIYDGTGGASYKADIGIKNGYIKTSGAIKINGRRDIDAEGLYVSCFIEKPYVMTGSDGHVQVPDNSFTHPRSYGTFTRKIRKYVIEKKVISAYDLFC